MSGKILVIDEAIPEGFQVSEAVRRIMANPVHERTLSDGTVLRQYPGGIESMSTPLREDWIK